MSNSWRNQPRHPRGSEQGGQWAEDISAKIAADRGLGRTRVPGRDLTGWAKENSRRLPALERRYDPNALGPSYQYDHVLAELGHQQGWDALPQVESSAEIDQKVKDGWVEIFRGVRGEADRHPVWGWGDEIGQPVPNWREDRTPRAAHQRLREGPVVQYGRGIYGNGLYFSVKRPVAEMYGNYASAATALSEPNAVQRVVLRPDARVVDYDELLEQFSAQSSYGQILLPPLSYKGDIPPAIGRDLGRYAAMLGYDAIKIRDHDDGYGTYGDTMKYADQYVVLNRTALVFEQMEGVRGDT